MTARDVDITFDRVMHDELVRRRDLAEVEQFERRAHGSDSDCGRDDFRDRTTVGQPAFLVDLAPTDHARARRIIAKVGEAEFRRGVAEMTEWEITDRTLNDVICLYVLGLQGRLRPIEMGRRAAKIHMTLPQRTADDAGFSDGDGRPISPEEWLQQRGRRIADRNGQVDLLGIIETPQHA